MLVVVLVRETRFMKTTNELRSGNPCEIQLGYPPSAIPYHVNETRFLDEGTTTRATLLDELPDGILEGGPVYWVRERETRFQ